MHAYEKGLSKGLTFYGTPTQRARTRDKNKVMASSVEEQGCCFLKRQQMPCLAHYRFQCVKTKAAVRVLLLSAGLFCAVCVLRGLLFVKLLATSLPLPWCVTLNFVLTFTAVVVYPAPGYLGDVYYRRFGVMKCGLSLVWCGALATTIATLLDDHHYVDESNLRPVYITFLTLISVGTSAFHANIVPFGLEQLQASSSEEIVAFTHCYLWIEMLGVAVAYVFSCVQAQETLYVALSCFVLTTGVVIGMVECEHHVVIERTSKPLSLKYILGIVQLQCNVQQPPNERNNLTGRQLSEVIAAFQIMPILVVFGLATVTNVHSVFVVDLLSSEFSSVGEPPQQACYIKVVSVIVPFLAIIPLYHFALHPFLHRCVPSILNRIVVGLALYTLGTIYVFILEAAGHYSTQSNAQCFLSTETQVTTASVGISYHWLIVLHIINAIALFAATSAIYEFIAAKSPYSVKGLMVGLMYASSGIGRLVGLGVLLVFGYQYQHISASFHTDPSSCGLWYYALNIVLSLGVMCLFVLAARNYERKQNTLSSQGVDHWTHQSTNV
eukprot:Em0006g558a